MATQTAAAAPLTREEESILIELGRSAQSMYTDLAASGSSRFRQPVLDYQRFWNYALPQLRHAVAVAGSSLQLGPIIEDGLYGRQTAGSLFVTISLFDPHIPAPPTVASGMSVWYAQNSSALEALIPPYGAAVPPEDLEPSPMVDVTPTLDTASSGGSTVRQLTDAAGVSSPVPTVSAPVPPLPVETFEPDEADVYGPTSLVDEVEAAPSAGSSCISRGLTSAGFLSCVNQRVLAAGEAQPDAFAYYGFTLAPTKMRQVLTVLGLPVEEAMAQADMAADGNSAYLEIELNPLQVSILTHEFAIASSAVRVPEEVLAYETERLVQDLPTTSALDAPIVNEAPPELPTRIVALPRSGFAPVVAVGVGAAALGGVLWAFTRKRRRR